MERAVRRGLASSLRALFIAAMLAGCVAIGVAAGVFAEDASGAQRPFKVGVLANGLQNPWGIAFLPNGSALVTERDTGRILRVTPEGGVRLLRNIPEAGAGEGGLLGIAVSPNVAKDRLVFVYYTTATDNRVARFRLGKAGLSPVLTGIPRGNIHNGGRIGFGPDRLLYVTTGDAGDASTSQNQSSLAGKILRVGPKGGIPEDNPFNSPVYTLGHRNVQGIAWDANRRLFATELGSNRFDEINLIRRGGNYGWPIVEGTANDPRFVNPIQTFATSEASPSGAAIPRDPKVKSWKGDLFVATLRGQRLYRLELNGGRVTGGNQLLRGEYGRLRHVAEAPDGSLWVLTSNGSSDRILRLTRAG